MTITLTPEQIYGGIVTLLLILQAWHHYRLSKHIEQTQIHLGQIWIQINTLTTSIAAKFTELEKKVNEKVGKQDKTA
jgi:hypothetical protein